MASAEGFRDRLLALMLHLNERQLRLAAALESAISEVWRGFSYWRTPPGWRAVVISSNG